MTGIFKFIFNLLTIVLAKSFHYTNRSLVGLTMTEFRLNRMALLDINRISDRSNLSRKPAEYLFSAASSTWAAEIERRNNYRDNRQLRITRDEEDTSCGGRLSFMLRVNSRQFA